MGCLDGEGRLPLAVGGHDCRCERAGPARVGQCRSCQEPAHPGLGLPVTFLQDPAGRKVVRLAAVLGIALVLATWAVALASVPAARGAAPTSITTCTDAAFRQAVLAGGTVRFDVDCTDLQLSGSIDIGAGLDVTVDGNGHTVVLDAGQADP